MLITGKTVLVLGGWGLVGSAVCNKLMEHNPLKLVITSLRKEEAEDAVAQLRKLYPKSDPNMFVAKWGNIFTRTEWKDTNWAEILNNEITRKGAIEDIYNELTEQILERSALYSVVTETKPDIVVECINTATAIAYQDVYNTTNTVKRQIDNNQVDITSVEKMMASVYIPQLIRHVQIFYKALIDSNTKMYVKVGTSGTGGMGLNIPYTHSEERPSRVLLAKAAVGGAQSLLLFLMARTPNGPIVKEIKPTAAIAWKRIAYDKVMRKGRPIPLVDMSLENAHSIEEVFKFDKCDGIIDKNDVFKSVFIDTGENGIFSKGEFQAISSVGQMEIVTPEEIAECLVFEILGGNSGHDIVQGLDSFTLGPTYRAGMLQHEAMKRLEAIEKKEGVDSIAFELLGPPRLSKLLFETYIIKRIAGSMRNYIKMNPENVSEKALEIINNDVQLRSQMLSIGLVVLLPDGKKYIRGKEVKIPSFVGDNEIQIKSETIEKWCFEAWVDLRVSNFKYWQEIFTKIISQCEQIPENDTSSKYTYNIDYWNDFETINEGKIAGWMFEFEDGGWRFKR